MATAVLLSMSMSSQGPATSNAVASAPRPSVSSSSSASASSPPPPPPHQQQQQQRRTSSNASTASSSSSSSSGSSSGSPPVTKAGSTYTPAGSRAASPTPGSPKSTGASSAGSLGQPSSPTAATPSPVAAADANGTGMYSYLDSFIKSLNKVLSLETAEPASAAPSPPSAASSPPQTPANDWQASYLSPVHTKLKREGRQLEQHREKDINALRAKFNGVLPFFRVWELKVEEMDSEPPTMGRGTPPRPHKQIFTKELSATRLFLKDYQKRRGLTRVNNGVNETQMDPNALRRSKPKRPMPTKINTEPVVPKGKAAKTQSISPDRVIERRKAASASHHRHSKLVSSLTE